MNMGERIKYARERAGLSKAEMARRVGVSRGAPTQWEANDIKNLRMENLFAIEDATGFNARWIALGEGPQRPPRAPLSPVDFDEEIAQLPPEDLAALLRFAAEQIAGQ